MRRALGIAIPQLPSPQPLLAGRIAGSYAMLSKRERLLADAVLSRVEELAGYTATELAAQAHVSKATATRFFRKLGYADFEQARLEVRSNRFAGSPLEDFDASAPAGRADDTGAYLVQEVANIRESYAGLTTAQLDAAAATLSEARKLWVVGFRDSYPVALSASLMLKRVVDQVTLLPRDGNLYAEDLIGLGSRDAVLAVGFRRRPRILSTLLKIAEERRSRIILLTDASPARATAHAVTFRCPVGAGVFDSYAAGLSVLTMLCSRTARLRGEHGKTRLHDAEQLHAVIKDLQSA